MKVRLSKADAVRHLNVSCSVVQRLWNHFKSEDPVSREDMFQSCGPLCWARKHIFQARKQWVSILFPDQFSVVPARISSQSSRHCWRSPLPHTSTLIQRDFGYVLGVHQTKQLSHVAKVDLVKDPESEPARKQFNFGDWRRNFGQCVSRVATHYPFEIWLWPSPEGKEGQLAPTPRRCSAGYLKVSAMRTKEV
ncbi:hypothetical protein TNCV_2322432 [Trichonephila clavipes]|nr:hypothetical protein TNCV_2322432 [Trichonephila clavipes]